MKSAYLVITSEAIQNYYTYFLSEYNSENYIEFQNKYAYLIFFTMRNCIRGEIYMESLNL